MRYSVGRAVGVMAATAVVVLGMAGIAAATTTRAVAPAVVADPASVVDTRVMTTGGGNDFPGVDVPFGVIQWSPGTSPSRPPGGGYKFPPTPVPRLHPTPLGRPRRR